MSDKLPYKVGELQSPQLAASVRCLSGALSGRSGPLEFLAWRDLDNARPLGGWSSRVVGSRLLEATADYKSRRAPRGPVQRRGLRSRQFAANFTNWGQAESA